MAKKKGKPTKAAKKPATAASKHRAAPSASQSKGPAKKQPAKRSSSYFVHEPTLDPVISTTKPAEPISKNGAMNFDEAKERAVDLLIDLIDRCEHRLWQLKRAESFADFVRLSSDPVSAAGESSHA